MKHTEELKQIKSSTPREISAKITDSRVKLVKLNQDKILGKLKNFREITTLRKSIARMNTILDEKVRENINA
jgi:large subunit ribosomal protein L29